MVPTRSLLLVTQEIQNYISPYISKINPIFHGYNPPLRDNYPTDRRPLGAFAAYSPDYSRHFKEIKGYLTWEMDIYVVSLLIYLVSKLKETGG